MRPAWRWGWLWAVLALLGVGLFGRLGIWQLSRAEDKQVWAAAVAQAAQAAPLDNQAASLARQQPEVMHRRVRLVGHWLPEHAVYLENRTMGGATGFLLVMPFALDAQTVLGVQRGWIPRHRVDPYQLAPVETPSGEVTIEGIVSVPPSQYFALGDEAQTGLVRSNLNWSAYAQAVGFDLGVWSVRQEGEATEGLRRSWDPIDAKISTHYGYAVQWFALAALTVVLYVWFQIIQPRRRRA